jgi:hypothetical protein
MYSIKDDDTIIKIYFNKPFYKNLFNELYFTPNKNVVYYDKSHVNYIYNKTIDDIKYTFYGFFKDNFFVIIFDSFDNNLQINIKNKYLFLIKLEWQLLEIEDNKHLWVLDYLKLKNIKDSIFILTIRKNSLENQYINIDEYMKISEYEKNTIYINIVNNNEEIKNNENNNTKNNNTINKYLNYIPLFALCYNNI